MISDVDIWRAANLLIRRFGEDARRRRFSGSTAFCNVGKI